MAYTTGTASTVSGVKAPTLDYWAKTFFVQPSIDPGEGQGNWRLYSFLNLVELRTAARLRKAGISLQGLRRVVEFLRQAEGVETPLAESYLVTDGQDVFIKHGAEQLMSVLQRPGQKGWPWLVLNLSDTVAEVRERVSSGARTPRGREVI